MKNLWAYRELILNLVGREFRVRYRGGWPLLWVAALQPLVVVLVYLFGLHTVMKVPVPNYPLFLAAGCLHWTMFSSILLGLCRAVTGNANLVCKVRFPLEILPISVLISELLLFSLSLGLFWLLFPALGGQFWPGLLLYPLLLALNLAFLSGTALMVSALQVYFEGFQELVGLLIRVLFWFSPVIYSFAALPSSISRWLLGLNPAVAFLDCYRGLLYDRSYPDPAHWLALFGWTGLSLWLGRLIFFRLAPTFADEL